MASAHLARRIDPFSVVFCGEPGRLALPRALSGTRDPAKCHRLGSQSLQLHPDDRHASTESAPGPQRQETLGRDLPFTTILSLGTYAPHHASA